MCYAFFKKMFFSVFVFFISIFCLHAQNELIDSLKKQLPAANEITKIQIYSRLADILIPISIPEAKDYTIKGLLLAQKNKDSLSYAKLKRLQGKIYLNTSQTDSATICFQAALKIFYSKKLETEVAATLVNIGACYYSGNLFDKALESFNEALEIFKHLNQPRGLAYVYNNIGMIHLNQNKYEEAILDFKMSIENKTVLQDEIGIAHSQFCML